MITKKLQFALLLAVAVYFVLLAVLLKKKRLLLKYSLLWILSGILMLVFAAFPQLLHDLARMVGIYDP